MRLQPRSCLGFAQQKANDAELYSLQKVGQGALTLKKLEGKCAAAAGAGIGREKRQRAGS